MKVKTWIRKFVQSYYVEDKNIKDMLYEKGIYNFYTYKEQIIDIDLNEVVDDCKNEEIYEAGYRYSNRLYNIVHSKTKFISEKDDLEYKIIEDDYPTDIPYAYCEFDDVEEFHKWMLEEGIKEKKELE